MLNDVDNYISGNINFLNKDSLPQYIQEQVQLRSSLCSDCAAHRKCLKCTCKTPEMFYAPRKVDKAGRWAQFLNEEQWSALKDNIDDYYKFFRSLRGSRGDSSSTTELVSNNT